MDHIYELTLNNDIENHVYMFTRNMSSANVHNIS